MSPEWLAPFRAVVLCIAFALAAGLPGASLAQRSNDVLITGKVRASFVDAADLQATAFKVVTERGTVYLMGRVTQREADRATQIARNIGGVQRVVRIFEILTEEDVRRMSPLPAARPAAAQQPLAPSSSPR